MRPRPILLVAGLAGLAGLTLASCEPPRADHPLSDPHSAKLDARLVGMWSGHTTNKSDSKSGNDKSQKEDVVDVLVMPVTDATDANSKGAPGQFDLVLVGHDSHGAEVITFRGFATQLGGKSYLNLREKSFSGAYASKTTFTDHYIFARYELGKDGALTLFTMDETPVKAPSPPASCPARSSVTMSR